MRALVLSGGGAKGSFQAGAIDWLMKEGGMKFDAVAGVSVGALNGALVASGRHERLIPLWSALERDHVYKTPSPADLLGAIMGQRKSAFKNVLLKELICRETEGLVLSIPFHYGAVSLKTGLFQEFEHLDPACLLASAAIPGAFEPVLIGDDLFIDGGIRRNSPLRSIIDRYHDQIKEIVIVNCSTWEAQAAKTLPDTMLTVLMRSMEISLNRTLEADMHELLSVNNVLRQVEAHNRSLPPEAERLVIMHPSGRAYHHYKTLLIQPGIPLGGLLDFGKEQARSKIQLGMEAARRALSAGFDAEPAQGDILTLTRHTHANSIPAAARASTQGARSNRFLPPPTRTG